MAIGSHQSARAQTIEWLTPPEIVQELGPFDLDPCCPANRPWDTAKAHYSADGLLKPWDGRVWLNPPYGQETWKWLKKLAQHGNGIAMVFARTETKMFFKYVWPTASAVLFIEGRLHFYRLDGLRAKGNSGGPSVLIAYGDYNAIRLKKSKISGKFVDLQPEKHLR